MTTAVRPDFRRPDFRRPDFRRLAEDLVADLVGPEPRFSLLTPGGGAVEDAFSTAGEPAMTVDPRPGRSQAEKWAAITGVLNATGWVDPRRTDPVVAELAARSDLRFGAWLGVRTGSGDRPFKLYQEALDPLGASTRAAMRRDLSQPWLDGLEPRLVGTPVGPEGGGAAAREWYFSIRRPTRSGLHRLFASADQADKLPYLLDCLSMAVGAPLDEALTRIGLGISVTGQSPRSLTLYLHCSQIFADEVSARRAVLTLCRELGRTMHGYPGAGPDRAGGVPAHGLLGLKAGPGLPHVGVGVGRPDRPDHQRRQL